MKKDEAKHRSWTKPELKRLGTIREVAKQNPGTAQCGTDTGGCSNKS